MTVIIYSTLNQAGLAKDSKIEAVYDDITRREAFEDFIKTKPEASNKWQFNRRNLIITYRSGKRHGRDVKYFFTEYLEENDFYALRDEQRKNFISGRGENWEEYQERLRQEKLSEKGQ